MRTCGSASGLGGALRRGAGGGPAEALAARSVDFRSQRQRPGQSASAMSGGGCGELGAREEAGTRWDLQRRRQGEGSVGSAHQGESGRLCH